MASASGEPGSAFRDTALSSGGAFWSFGRAADFDGEDAIVDAQMYVKAARAFQVPVALEVSKSGVGMHAWTFFTAPVPAETARRVGTGLLREVSCPAFFGQGFCGYFTLLPCPFRYSSRTSCGVRYPSVEWRRVLL
jgi:hypothetical protein